MAIEMLVGLHVIDDGEYRTYREQMAPILQSYGGEFGYDFQVSRVLQSKTTAPMNRVFTISFPNKDSMDSFFSNDGYLKIKQGYFENSVTSTTIISTYERM